MHEISKYDIYTGMGAEDVFNTIIPQQLPTLVSIVFTDLLWWILTADLILLFIAQRGGRNNTIFILCLSCAYGSIDMKADLGHHNKMDPKNIDNNMCVCIVHIRLRVHSHRSFSCVKWVSYTHTHPEDLTHQCCEQMIHCWRKWERDSWKGYRQAFVC